VKKVLRAAGAALLIVVVVLLVRTGLFTSRQLQVEPASPVAIDIDGAVERLAGALRFQTVAGRDAAGRDDDEFTRFHEYLAASFPRVHAALSREAVEEHAALYTWQGTDPALAPALLMAHIDVVPVEAGTTAAWTHPPFAGRVADGYVWGRGAIDSKGAVLALLEAAEHLLGEGHRPARTMYLAFGHDEEVGGAAGAARIAAHLEQRGVRLEYVLDEGGIVMEDGPLLPGAPVALVGIAEKGYVSLELTTEAAGGHSSMPPRQTAIGIVSRALVRLEEHPFPGGVRGPTREMVAYVGPEMPFAWRLPLANLWLFGPLVERQLARSPSANAMLRTTAAPTIFEAGSRDNVLPVRARAVVNFRVFPGDTVEAVIERVRRVVDDPRVRVARLENFGQDPSPVSPTDALAFERLQRTIRQVFPGAVVAPYVVVGATDSRHYRGLTESVYRFLPLRLREEDLLRIHGIDERVSIEGHADAIRFYRQLIVNSSPSDAPRDSPAR
jgi:carboxypeptidase PM20D1